MEKLQRRSSWRLWAASAGAWLLLMLCCCCCPEPVGATLCNELTMLSEECQCDEFDGRLTLRWANIHASPLLSDLERVAEAKIPLYEIQLEANMFDSLPLLDELAVNSAHLVSVRENAFVKLNLSRLWLRHNHLTQVPGAVSKLPYLRELDLFENRIEVVTDQEALVLQSNLKHLRRLVMNKMQCDCDLGKGEFLSWIRRANISGVKCGEPPFLLSKDVTALTTKQFCDGAAAPPAGAVIVVALAAAIAARHFAVSAS
ncbi:leucine-rich repeat-containing protein 4C isoform X2 [Dermacentor silvarum]|uniref:leucine-rich repeat-containing protein 4C isoform X2 n=1 Tax=Dermacentor silvarum TaxID=543639 RepID=UPI002100A8D6|nr:leucine-rich repeat-containing protein 4C isoform X2 [Dermacentor silvarum]